jgi:hypothetical protein
MLGIGQHVNDVTFGHALAQQAVDQRQAFGVGLFLQSTQDRFAILNRHYQGL